MLLYAKYISIYSIHFILYYLDKKTIYEHFFYSYYLNSIRKNYIANLSLC